MRQGSVKSELRLDRTSPEIDRPLRGLIEFYERWLATHLRLNGWFAELGHSGPGHRGFTRNLYRLPRDGAETIASLRHSRNVMVSVARYPEPVADPGAARYPLLALDFDCPAQPAAALIEAAGLARLLRDLGTDPVLVRSGFKGAHLYVPLAGLATYEEIQVLADFIAHLARPLECRGRPLIDWQAIRDPRRLMRAPYTWNLKEDGRRLAIILDERLRPLEPRDFDWGRPLDPRSLGVALVVSRVPRVRVRRLDRSGGARWGWVEEVLMVGLPDGRKRFILYVASRYLVNVLGLDREEALHRLQLFLERSCTRHGNCGRIYESWIASVLRGVSQGGYKPLILSTLASRDPELVALVKQVVHSGSKP